AGRADPSAQHLSGGLHPRAGDELRSGGGAAALQPVSRLGGGNQQRPRPLPRRIRRRRATRRDQVPGPGKWGDRHRAAEGGAGGFGGDEVKRRTVGRSDSRTVVPVIRRVAVGLVLLSVSPTVRPSAQSFPTQPPRPTPLSPVRFPPFKEATLASELALARTRALSALALELSQPASVAGRIFAKEIYGPNPYGRNGTRESYNAVTRDDVAQLAADRLRPAGALLVVAGDVTELQVRG